MLVIERSLALIDDMLGPSRNLIGTGTVRGIVRRLRRGRLAPRRGDGPARYTRERQYAGAVIRHSIILDPAVERPLECVPRGVRQGATRRRRGSTPTRCNAVGRRAGRAPRAVAAITRRVRRPMTKIVNRVKPLHAARSGQLPDLGSWASTSRGRQHLEFRRCGGWDSRCLGVKYASTDRSEPLAAWNRRIDNTDNQNFNIGVTAKCGY
jgi:hypothetical protein